MAEQLSFSDYTSIVKRRVPLFSLTLLAGALATIMVAFGLPAVYQSSSTILIEQQNLPPELVQSTVTGYADERIQVVSQRVMATNTLAQLIETYGLYPDLPNEGMVPRVRKMQESIFVEPISAEVINPRSGRPSEATIAFTVAFEHESPATARDIAVELTSLFIEENRRDRGEQAQEAVAFLEMQAQSVREEIAKLEADISEFKSQNQGVLNEDVNMASLDLNQRRLSDTRSEIRRQEQRLRFLRAERVRLVEEAGGAVDRLGELQAEYARVSALYAPDHPDVVRLRKELEQLTSGGESGALASQTQLAQVERELELARQKYSEDHPDVQRLQRRVESLRSATRPMRPTSVVASPAIRALDSDIREAQATLAALQQTRAELEKEIETDMSRMQGAPEVQRQFNAMQRLLAEAETQSTEIQAKLSDARLSARLEEEQMAERFTLVDEPRLPANPSRPNRIGLLLLGFILAIAIAGVVLAVAEVADRSVRGPRDVEQVLGVPPIASIPLVETRADRRKVHVRWAMYTATAAVMVIGTVIGLDWLA